MLPNADPKRDVGDEETAAPRLVKIVVVLLDVNDCFFLPFVQEQRDILIGLRQAAFENESENSLSNERRRSLCAKEFKKLGFSVSRS